MGAGITEWATVSVGKGLSTGLNQPAMAATTVEENERIARDHFDRVWNNAEFDDAILAPDYHVVLNNGEHSELTREEFRAKVRHFQDAFPDLRKEPIDVIATDETVVIPYTFTGTHENELMGIPATGNEVEISAVVIDYVEDGQIAKEWFVADFLRMMRQLGVAD